MRDNGDDGLRVAVVQQHLGGFGQRTARVGHIVDDDTDLIGDVTDENHSADFVSAGSLLVDQREVQVQSVGQRSGTLGTTGVRGDDDGVLVLDVLLDVAYHTWLGIQVVHWDIEETLDLGGMQVHGDHVVTTGGGQHVCHQLCGDGSPGLVLSVLSGVREVRNDGSDASGGRGLGGVDHDQ